MTALLDLDEDGVYETDISAYVRWEASLQAQGLGRQSELDRAGVQSLTIHVENKDGRFTPKNAAGPYYPALRDLPFGVKVQISFDGDTFDLFTGRVWKTVVNRQREGQEAWLECRERSEAFERAEITLPLMLDIYTGTMVHRVLDIYEGELCANPRFASDLAGYGVSGGATNTRVTTRDEDGDILEGAAAMETAATAAGEGWTRDVSAGESAQDASYVYTAYIWRPSGGEAPTEITLRALRDAAEVTTTGAVALVAGRWTRVELAVAWPDLAGVRSLSCETVDAGAVTFRTGALHIVEKVEAIARRVDAGQSRLRNNAYKRVFCGAAVEEIRVNELGGLFYFAPDAAAVFEDTHHRWREDESRVSQATFDGDFDGLDYSESAADRVSEVIFDYVEWEEGTPGSIVWGLFPVPQEIPPMVGGEPGRLKIPIDHEGGLVRDPITPVANEDYFISTAPTGGVDGSADIDLEWEHFGGGADAALLNNVTEPRWTTSFQYRGTPVRQGTARKAVEFTPASRPRENLPLTYRYSLNSNRNRLETWAQYQGNRHGPPQEAVVIYLSAPWPEVTRAADIARAKEILGRAVSERITVTDTGLPWSSAVDGDYWIEAIDRTVEGEKVSAVLVVSPVDAQQFMKLDVDNLDQAVLA